MIKLSSVFHRHDWIDKGEHFATLPKANLPPDTRMGMDGLVQECECGAKRFMPPGLRPVPLQ